MPPSKTVTTQPNFLSVLKAQRLTEELVSAQEKIKEYEDLLATLYHSACEHCKVVFQRIGVAGASPVPEPYISLPRSPTSQGSSTPTIGPPEPAPEVGICAVEPPSDDPPPPSKVSVPVEDDPIQARYFVHLPEGTVGKSTAPQLKLERVWAHNGLVKSVKFSPDGKYLAVGITDDIHSQKTSIYDVTIGRKICLLTDGYAEEGYQSSVFLSFSPGDGKYLATGHSTGQTVIWQVREKRVRNAFGIQQDGCADFSPDGRFVISSSFQRSGVRIWSMRDGSSVVLQDPDDGEFRLMAVKFSPDGKHVVASDLQSTVRLWNVRASKLVRKWKAHEGTARDISFTGDGKGLVTGSDTLKYWDLSTSGFGDLREIKFVGDTDQVFSTSISSDDRWVVSGSATYSASIWDIPGASLQCMLMGHENVVSAVDFSPIGGYVACGSWDGKVSVWRYESSED